MIVELIGPSGSGKTTLVRRLDKNCEDQTPDLLSLSDLRKLENEIGWRKMRKDKGFQLFRQLLGFSLAHPSIGSKILALTILQGRPFRWRAARRVQATYLLAIHLKNHLQGRIAILDEGFIQSLWALLIGSKELRGRWYMHRLIRAYNRAIRPMNVLLDVGPTTARSRVFARTSKGRFNMASSETLKEQFEFALDHHQQIVGLMSPDFISTTIDGTTQEAEIVERLVQAIHAKMRGNLPNGMSKDDVTLALNPAQQ